MFEQTFKNIDDILYKDSGCSNELDAAEKLGGVASTRNLFVGFQKHLCETDGLGNINNSIEF
ncbi:MAG: hypothetical protein K8H86_04760 [Ignavibacteriaceae bacterium]|nr:hypothetical protein [Ignavibacteriaceae bacterium]